MIEQKFFKIFFQHNKVVSSLAGFAEFQRCLNESNLSRQIAFVFCLKNFLLF